MEEVHLTELTLDRGNEWIGKMVSEICPRPGKLVIMIQRAEDIIIPNGKNDTGRIGCTCYERNMRNLEFYLQMRIIRDIIKREEEIK